MNDVPFLRLVALAIRAGRRDRGLSQRAFAAIAGLSQSTVARLETSKASVQLDDLRLALAMVGLRLSIVREDGTSWMVDSALDLDVVGIVDRGGRQFPAHLPEDVETYEPCWRRFRDERAGYRHRSQWTFRRTTVEEHAAWLRLLRS
jgi:transcriptional regulator with XRE-family HTH domain